MAMKLLKKGSPSFRSKKSKTTASAGGSSNDASSTPELSADNTPASDSGPNKDTAPPPPDSPKEGDRAAGASETPREGSTNATFFPSSPTKSSKKNSQSFLRPLRLGSFDFDNPDLDSKASSQTKSLNFPPLYHEADDMLNLSNLIYTLAELRDLARNGVLNNPAQSMRILDMPLPLDTAMKIISAEGELLKEVLDDGKHEATLSALQSLLSRQEEKMKTSKEEEGKNNKDEENKSHKKEDSGYFGNWMTSWDGCLAGGFSFDEIFCGSLGQVVGENDDAPAAKQQQQSSMIAFVGDAKSNDELVYAVGINPIEERITVVFRGSATKQDFVTDAKISLVQAPDPRKFNGAEGSEDNGDVGVHQGFYEYLFGEQGGRKSKYAEIIKQVSNLLAENPTRRHYKLYVTGHSLGGALATLFGFYAASSPSLPLPVTVVSIASPRVGNIAFARTFAELESQGKLRHLRIVNHKDPVTLGPTVSSKRALALSAKAFSPLGYLALKVSGNGEGGDEEIYFHTGMKMKLFKNVSAVGSQRCELTYSGATIVSGTKKPVAIDKDDMAEIEQSNKRKKKESSSELPMVSYHYGTSYSERMASVESDLKGMTLNTLYREKACGMSWK